MNTIEKPSDRLTELEQVAVTLAAYAYEIRLWGKEGIEKIDKIGAKLEEAHALITGPRGKHAKISWPDWLDSEFGWSEQSAANFRNAHRLLSSRKFRDEDLPNIQVSALYLLAKPSTPPEVVDQAARQAKTRRVTHKKVQATIRKRKSQKAAKPKSPKTGQQAEPEPQPAQASQAERNPVVAQIMMADAVAGLGSDRPAIDVMPENAQPSEQISDSTIEDATSQNASHSHAQTESEQSADEPQSEPEQDADVRPNERAYKQLLCDAVRGLLTVSSPDLHIYDLTEVFDPDSLAKVAAIVRDRCNELVTEHRQRLGKPDGPYDWAESYAATFSEPAAA
jgi:hypothetical protein